MVASPHLSVFVDEVETILECAKTSHERFEEDQQQTTGNEATITIAGATIVTTNQYEKFEREECRLDTNEVAQWDVMAADSGNVVEERSLAKIGRKKISGRIKIDNMIANFFFFSLNFKPVKLV